MKPSILLTFFIINAFSSIIAQDLCGYWIGYGYQCSRFNPIKGYEEIFNVPYELIYIFQNQDSVKAIKIIGDDCVTSGHETWRGIFVASEKRIKNVSTQVGSRQNPNSAGFIHPDFFVLKDSLNSSPLRFKRLTCEQAQKLGANLLDQRYICDCSNIEPCKIELPNAFTPNNDGLNDIFALITACQLKTYDMKIFNRWGKLVFQAQEMPIGWNGTLKGHDLPSDVYIWVINATTINGKPIKQSGEVTLMR